MLVTHPEELAPVGSLDRLLEDRPRNWLGRPTLKTPGSAISSCNWWRNVEKWWINVGFYGQNLVLYLAGCFTSI